MTYLLVLIVVILFTCVCSMHFNLRKAAEIRANDLIELAKQDNELIELRRENTELAAENKQLRGRAADTEKHILAGRKRENSSAATNSSPAASSVSDNHRSAVDALSPLSSLNPMSPVYVGADYASGSGETATHCHEPKTRSSSSDGGSSYGSSSSYDSGSSYSSDSSSSSSSSSSCD